MAKVDEYRHSIERAIVQAELSPSDEIKKLWLNIREHYEYPVALEMSLKGNIPLSKLASNGRVAMARQHG